MVRLVAATAAVVFIVASSPANANDSASSAAAETAAPTATAAGPSTTAANDASDRVICKSTVPIGSRLGRKKTCMTAREWDDLRTQTRGITEKMQSKGWKEQ